MRSGSVSLTLVAGLMLSVAMPVSAAPGKPSAAMDLTNGCAGAVYSWQNQKKGVVAQIEVRPDGALDATFEQRPVGSSGSMTIGAYEFEPSQRYTIFGLLRDASGRAVTQSGAVWWGYCS